MPPKLFGCPHCASFVCRCPKDVSERTALRTSAGLPFTWDGWRVRCVLLLFMLAVQAMYNYYAYFFVFSLAVPTLHWHSSHSFPPISNSSTAHAGIEEYVARIEEFLAAEQFREDIERALTLPLQSAKLYASDEALQEIDALQHYTRHLARHDLDQNHSEPVFAMSAFDLESRDALQVARGLEDLTAFLAPDNHAHAEVDVMPISWRFLQDRGLARFAALCMGGPLARSMPFQMHLTSFLRGGAPKAKPAAASRSRRVVLRRPFGVMLRRPARRDPQWRMQYQAACDWQRSHARQLPHRKGRSRQERDLARWITNRRQQYAQGVLSDARIALLERLPGWTWDENAHSWDSNLAKLRQFLRSNDNKYPKKNAELREERMLARWMQDQRQRFRRAELDAHEERQLQALSGWTWDVHYAATTCCFLEPSTRARCVVVDNLRLAPNGHKYCKKHYNAVCGLPTRRPPAARLVQDGPQRRAACEWLPHCSARVQSSVGDCRYCARHALLVCGVTRAVMSLADYSDAAVPAYDCGQLGDVHCGKCGAYNFPGEEIRSGEGKHFKICCGNGKYYLYPLERPPPELLEIFVGTNFRARHAREQLKTYNNALAFVSFGQGTLTGVASHAHAPPVIVCHGLTYHNSGFLFPQQDEQAQYAQIYLYDHAEALHLRQRNMHVQGLDKDLLGELMIMLERECPYVEGYRHMRNLWNTEGAAAGTLRIVTAVEHDIRRYNNPRTLDPAVVFVSESGVPPTHRDIAVWPRDPNVATYRIDETSEHVDPLAYPLLFPRGEPGWNACLQHNGDRTTEKYTRFTAVEFYAHRLMIRDFEQEGSPPEENTYLEHSLPHSAGVLFQQWVCDVFSRAEAQRLKWFEYNQDLLRADTYQGLYDAVHDPSYVEGKTPIGKKLILPATYPGSPRAMTQNYLDAMAMVRRYGKPDYFITMTANPAWPEIANSLRHGETAHNRPDIVARVFHQKFHGLLHELLREKVLGPVVGYTWVIEFQKRGLPHAHLLLIVAKEHKPRTPEDIDCRIVAEQPDAEDPAQRELLEIVMNSQIHGPCGVRNPGCVCMEDGRCTKNFPKDFLEETLLQDNGYPKYRRRASSPCVMKGLHPIDARDVVPYNPYLSKKFQCHLNVEYCGSIKAVKYLFKYTYKGHDRAALQFQANEIARYLDARYVGSSESCWRLLQFPMHDSSHTVVRLAVHRQDEHTVVWPEGTEQEALGDLANKRSTLMAWLELNNAAAVAEMAATEPPTAMDIDNSAASASVPARSRGRARGRGKRGGGAVHGPGKGRGKRTARAHASLAVDPRTLRYAEIPEYYSWDARAMQWRPRARKANAEKVIGRLHSANPSEGERYYLYLLLLHVKGPLSFDDLRGGTHKSGRRFQHECVARGLLASDDEYVRTLQDASVDRRPSQLRLLFAHLLLHCDLRDSRALWEHFQEELTEDYRRTMTGEAATAAALIHVRGVLQQQGKELADYHLPEPGDFVFSAADTNLHVHREKDYDRQEQRLSANTQRDTMYDEQAAAYDEIVAAVVGARPACFFVDGPGGAGKTYLYEALLRKVRGEGWIALACAWSGIAAVLLQGGRTCHSRFGLPVPMPRDAVSSSIKAQSDRAEVLRQARLIVWDEAPMAPREALECVDVLLRDLTRVDEPFGGKVVVLGGDYRQVLPVMPHSSREDIVSHSMQNHALWRQGFVSVRHLGRNMRAREDEEWRNFLLEIGDGATPICEAVSPFAIRLPEAIVAPKHWTHHDLACDTFPGLQGAADRCVASSVTTPDLQYFCERAILAPTNAVVDEVNAEILQNFAPEKLVTYYSEDEVDAASAEEKANWPLDFLHSLTPSGMPPHELTLAPGALVMLLRNLDADAGLCNGVRAIVVKCQPRVLDVLLVSGTHMGKRVYIPRISLAPKNPDLPFVLRRHQFPVKLAWAMTFNKAQGQTLKRAGLYLPTPIFSHGQLYVGFSRAGSQSRVKVLVLDTGKQGRYEGLEGIPDGVYTDNVVWPEALLQTAPSMEVDPVTPREATFSDTSSRVTSAHVEANDFGEVWDALSGVPPTPPETPRSESQRADASLSSDAVEFGFAPPNAGDVNVCLANVVNEDVLPSDTDDADSSDTDLEAMSTHPSDEWLKHAKQFALQHGMSVHEWAEVSRRSQVDIETYLGALSVPNSGGASSSGANPSQPSSVRP